MAYAAKDRTSYLGLFCVEMPEVRFEDLVRGYVSTSRSLLPIDPIFLAVCEENTIEVVSVTTSEPVAAGAKVVGDQVQVQIANGEACRVVIRLSGLRKGSMQRFPKYSKAQHDRNLDFWRHTYD